MSTAAVDRDQLFKIISGQQQLGSLSSSSSSSGGAITSADTAAAKQLWEEAGRKISDTRAAAAARSGSSSSSPAAMDKWSDPISFEEALRTWQQLLLIAGMSDGPSFEQVLLAGSSSSSSVDPDLQQQLEQLQHALKQITGLDVAAAVQQVQSPSHIQSAAADHIPPHHAAAAAETPLHPCCCWHHHHLKGQVVEE